LIVQLRNIFIKIKQIYQSVAILLLSNTACLMCRLACSCNFFKLVRRIDSKLVPSLLSRFLLVLTNTLVFFITELITVVMRFIIQTPGIT
jgi:hypothetical protein